MVDQTPPDLQPRENEFPQVQNLTQLLDSLDTAILQSSQGDMRAVKEAHDMIGRVRRETVDLIRHQVELATLYEVDRELASILNLNELLGSILNQAVRLVKAERGLLVLYHPSTKDFEIALTRGIDHADIEQPGKLTISRKLISHVLETRQPLITTDAQHDDRFTSSASIVAFQIRSVLAVPLVYQQDLIGAIYLDTRMNARTFQSSDLNLLTAMANQAAVAIHIAGLYENLEAKNREMAAMLQQLRETQDELIRTERLSAIGRMASTIIHDIKGPLTAVKGFAQLLGKPGLTDEQRAHFGELITQAVDSFVGMTQEILDYARGEQNLIFDPFNVEEFLQDMREFIVKEFAALSIDVRLHKEYTGTVIGDRQKLWRAVYNIAKNAAEAMTYDQKAGGIFDMTVRRSGPWVEFILSDTGPGIPPEVRGKLFQPFATFRKAHGTGLGLAIARSIVEAHRGHILVDSEIGRGSTFIIQLPVEVHIE